MTRDDCKDCSLDHFNQSCPTGCYNFPQAKLADTYNKRHKAGPYYRRNSNDTSRITPNCYRYIPYR